MATLNLEKSSETLADIPDRRKLTLSDLLIEQRVSFNRLIDALNSLNSELVDMKKVNEKVTENETKIKHLDEKVIPELEIKLNREMKLMNAKIMERIEMMEKDRLLENAHSRRRHVIVNGVKPAVIDRGESENTEQVFRDFLVNNLKLNSDYVNEMLFRDVHRLPKSTTHEGPPPIIAAFLCQKHRNDVLASAKELKGTQISLKSDLPKELNILRGRFLKEMKRLKEAGHTVRCVERAYFPVLQLKNPVNDKWENILTFDKKLSLHAALKPALRLNLQ